MFVHGKYTHIGSCRQTKSIANTMPSLLEDLRSSYIRHTHLFFIPCAIASASDYSPASRL
jgi:hypothetical protein